MENQLCPSAIVHCLL